MLSEKTKLEGVVVLTPTVFQDSRGHFIECFNQKKFEKAIGKDITFVQDNQSYSKHNVLRGLHYQKTPFEQGKLIRCVHGSIYDVAVDIRPMSNTFGQWVGTTLSAENCKQLWIPEGFAHGFLTRSSEAVVEYKVTSFYTPEAEGNIIWNDEQLRITWPLEGEPILSPKDQNALTFNEFSLTLSKQA